MWLYVGFADESLNRVQGVSQTFLGSGTVKKMVKEKFVIHHKIYRNNADNLAEII